MGLLSMAIWLPVAFGALLLAVGRDENARVVRALALVGAVASFASPGLRASVRALHLNSTSCNRLLRPDG